MRYIDTGFLYRAESMAKKMDEATRRLVRAGRMLLAEKGCAEIGKFAGVARQTMYT